MQGASEGEACVSVCVCVCVCVGGGHTIAKYFRTCHVVDSHLWTWQLAFLCWLCALRQLPSPREPLPPPLLLWLLWYRRLKPLLIVDHAAGMAVGAAAMMVVGAGLHTAPPMVPMVPMVPTLTRRWQCGDGVAPAIGEQGALLDTNECAPY